ncbi:putative inorganic phosphate cotransporter isoform X2 [Bemisia tabaci]
MNLPAAVLGRFINNKYLLAMSTTVGSILACTSPIIVSYLGWKGLTGLRLFQGVFQAFMMPMVHGIMSKWAPPQERGRLVGFILGGIQFGTMIILVMAGFLASSSLGWPSIFYISGALGLAWVVFWMIFGDTSPTNSKIISEEELKYIVKNINYHDEKEKRMKTPWRHILTSLPVWAVVVAHTAHNWGFWLLLTEMPQFFSSVLKINIKEDGLLSALPYLAMWCLMFPVSYVADKMIHGEIASITTTRKLWNSIGMWGGCVGLAALGYLDDQEVTAIITYIFIVAIGCSVNCGFNVNHMDLSPNFAGILMGMTNAAASAGGLLAPLSVAYIVKDMNSMIQWRQVFFSGAAILFFGNLFYIIFASGNLQKWNEPAESSERAEDNNKQKVGLETNNVQD